MKKVFLLLIPAILIVFTACRQNRLKVDVSNIDVSLKIKRLDQDLFKVTPLNEDSLLPQIKKEYGGFFKLYNYRIVRLGNPDDIQYPNYLQTFLTDPMIQKAKAAVDSVYPDLSVLKKQLTGAFKHYKYYFPDKKVPDVYTCISGFNQSVVMAQGVLGISLDNYLGANNSFYKELALPDYRRRNMRPEMIAPDAMRGWAMSEYPEKLSQSKLIDHMIYHGKLMYFLDAMFPDMADSLKIGYPTQKLEWCKKNEGSMWTYLVGHKLLFSTERLEVLHYINPAPYTNSFTSESPGRTGVWLGWQIVRKYMRKHKEISLEALMNDTNYSEILNSSGYNPD